MLWNRLSRFEIRSVELVWRLPSQQVGKCVVAANKRPGPGNTVEQAPLITILQLPSMKLYVVKEAVDVASLGPQRNDGLKVRFAFL